MVIFCDTPAVSRFYSFRLQVLKLAEGLIREIESPYKMSSAVINPVVFNATRLVMLSAFSAIVSELLGFKLKLYKVKL